MSSELFGHYVPGYRSEEMSGKRDVKFLKVNYRISSMFNSWHYHDCCHYYIYAFSRPFIPKRLTMHSVYTLSFVSMCSLGIEPTTFCAANAMLNHWATKEHLYFIILKELQAINMLAWVTFLIIGFFPPFDVQKNYFYSSLEHCAWLHYYIIL